MAAGAGLRVEIDWPAVRLLPGARALAEAGHVPGGTRTNVDLAGRYADFGPGVDAVDRALACDAQTSGGLLAALPADRAGALPWPVVGRVVEGPAGTVLVD
jgi:selenide,water dikinase